MIFIYVCRIIDSKLYLYKLKGCYKQDVVVSSMPLVEKMTSTRYIGKKDDKLFLLDIKERG